MSDSETDRAIFFIELLLDTLKDIENRGLTINQAIEGIEKSINILKGGMV